MNSYSISPLMSVSTSDLNSPSIDLKERLHKTAKTIEGVFVGQLMAEIGKSGGLVKSDSSDSGSYHDFIEQAMTQVVTKGNGFGLAADIEKYLNRISHQPKADKS